MINVEQGAAILPQTFKRLARCAAAIVLGASLFSSAELTGVGIAGANENVIKAGKGGAKSQRLTLGLDKSMVLELPEDAYDILVANPDVADAVSRTARRVYLFGKDIGETNIFVFGKGGEQIANLNLAVERDITGLQENLSKYIEDSDIRVEIVNDNVILTGTVQTAQDSARAESLASIFLTGGGASASAARLAARRANLNNGSNNIIITTVNNESSSSGVVNLLQILGDDQVTLKVTVAEISRVVMKQLGVSTVAGGSIGGQNISFSSPSLAGLGAIVGADALSSVGSIGSASLASYLNAMEQAGVMKTLAEPTLTAISGEKAEFRVGGEFNILREVSITPADAFNPAREANSFERIEYGIGLEFLPVVLSPGRISLKVRTSVSEPTFDGPGQGGGGGSTLPSLRKRLADTTVELPSGGSMMIAGLVRDDVRQVIGGYPGLKKIPILGSLFRSRDFVRNETELVIIVTPYLVRPVARNKLNRPDDNFNAASDGAGIFLGKINRVYGTMQTKLPAGRYHGVVGYIYK